MQYLQTHGETSGEVLTNECIKAGIEPHDARAFGSAFMRLAKAGKIIKVGTCLREKGHGTSGGNIWNLTIREASR